MYSTCIFCDKALGRNEVIESFPVGRRLAFDPRKGRLWVFCGSCRRWNLTPMEERWEAVILEGPEAKRAAGKVFPLLNHGGARLKTTEDAVSMLAETGGPEAFLAETWGKARPRPGASIRWVMSGDMKGGQILHLPPISRIAFEMALHQEQERKAMEGELEELRAAWRAAEEMAQISDNLLVPEEVEEKIEAFKIQTQDG